jgi:hypothetical protein
MDEEGEEDEWKKLFRNALDKSDRKKFLMYECLTIPTAYVYRGRKQ